MNSRQRQLFHEMLLPHRHILGDPGTGQSAKGLFPLIFQLIANGEVSVNIFDAKGELTQFDNAREEAERAGVLFNKEDTHE